MARTLGVLLLFTALSIAQTWPLADTLSRRVHAYGDVDAGIWSLTEAATRITRAPLRLMDGNGFHPFGDALAALDHQLSNALMVAPLAAGGAGVAFVYNLTLLLTFVLSGFFTYLLVRRLTQSTAAAIIAGCAFTFGSYRVGHLIQSHLLATQWLPLTLLALDRYVERPTWARWGALATVALLLAFSSWHVAVIGAVGVGVVALWTVVARPGTAKQAAGGLLLVAVLCGASLLPLARTYSRVSDLWPPLTGDGHETLDTLSGLSANVLGFAVPPSAARVPYQPFLQGLAGVDAGDFPGLVVMALALPALVGLRRLTARSPGPYDRLARWSARAAMTIAAITLLGAATGGAGEGLLDLLRPFAPVVVVGLALAGVGLAAARRSQRVAPDLGPVVTYAALAVAGALLALGPRVFVGAHDVGSGLWRLDLLPVPLVMRAPARFSLLWSFGLAVLAGVGAARLLARLPSVSALVAAAVLIGAVNLDQAFVSPQLMDVPGITASDRWLAMAPEEGAVLEYPLHGSILRATIGSRHHRRRIVNGTGYLIPGPYHALTEEPDLSPAQLALVWEHFHPRFIVIRADDYPPEDRTRVLEAIEREPDAFELRAMHGNEYVFELHDRGRGAELVRRWPAEALRGMRELVFEARVTEGRGDATGELAVALNGRPLLVAPNADTPHAIAYRVPFSRDDLIEGANTFELTAAYRFRPDTGRHPLGETGVRLAADIVVYSDRVRSIVEVNGRILRPERGYFLAELDPTTGRLRRTGAFNVSWYDAESARLAAFVREAPHGAPVIVAAEFDASRRLTAEAVQALRELGLATDLRGRFQTMHAAVGVKGAMPGTALEATGRLNARVTLGRVDHREIQLSRLIVR